MKVRVLILATLVTVVGAEVPASYERLFREQEGHIQTLEAELDKLTRELAKEKANSKTVDELKEKHRGLTYNFDKLITIKKRLETDLEKSKTQLAELKRYYALEQKEGELREKRLLKASSKVAETLQEREKKLSLLEDELLKLTGELKETQAKCAQLLQNNEAQARIVTNERNSIKKEIDRLQQELMETHKLATLKSQELEEAIKSNKQLRDVIDKSRPEIERLYTSHLNGLGKKLESAEKQAKEQSTAKIQAEQAMEKLKAEFETTNALLASAIKGKEEAVSERATLKKLMMDEFESFKKREIAAREREEMLRAELIVLKTEFDQLTSSDQVNAAAAFQLTRYKEEVESMRQHIALLGTREHEILEENKTLSKSNSSLAIKLAEAEHAAKYPSEIPLEVRKELSAKNRECCALRHRVRALEAEHHNLCIASERDSEELRKSLDDLVGEYKQVLSEKNRLEGELGRISQGLQATINEQDAAYCSHMEDVTSHLKQKEASLEKLRHELMVTTGAAKKLSGKHKEKLASINEELKIVRSQLSTAQKHLMAKEEAGVALGAQQYSLLKELETTRSMLKQKEDAIVVLSQELQKRADQIRATQDKTNCLLSALGFQEGADKTLQRATFLKLVAKRELESVRFDDLCAGKACISKGLSSILNDSQVLKSMLEDLGKLTTDTMQARLTFDERIHRADCARHCATLYKFFLARSQTVSDPVAKQREIEPLFARYTSLASRQLGNKEILNVKLDDISNQSNPLVKALIGNQPAPEPLSM